MTTGNTPTIGIDCRFAKTHSGIGRYTRELMKELKKRDDGNRYVFIDADIPHYSLKEQILIPKIIKKAEIDLLHVPHFNVPLKCPVPFVVTIHDLILHHYPNQASLMKRIAYKMLMKHAVKKSAHIITVSNSTADDIAKTYGEDVRSKMSVTYEGVSSEFYPRSDEEIQNVREKYKLPERFLLYVGANKEHKNVQTLVEACSKNWDLVSITGGNVDDADLPSIYSAASCFILPSLYEGFGLPILEAMACGCPVVASSRTSIPEIAGGNAILVEPTVEGISNGIKQAISSPPDRSRAMEHVKGFSWEKMADETAKIHSIICTND